MVRLIRPCLEYWTDYIQTMREIRETETVGFYAPLSGGKDRAQDALRRFWELENGVRLPPGFTPISFYWLMDGKHIIGVGSVRHALTTQLEIKGGHIGYAIAASMRGLGLGDQLLSLLLREAGRWGIKYALLTCREDNKATVKGMKKNGGHFLDSLLDPYGNGSTYIQRCLIDTEITIPHWREPNFRFYDLVRIPGEVIDLVLEGQFSENDMPETCPTYRFAICMPTKKTSIGYIDLRVGFDKSIYYSGNMGYRIDEKYRGHGYAATAVAMLGPLARAHHINPLTITCNPDNTPSSKTCENLGARYMELVRVPKDSDQYRHGDRLKRRFYLPYHTT